MSDGESIGTAIGEMLVAGIKPVAEELEQAQARIEVLEAVRTAACLLLEEPTSLSYQLMLKSLLRFSERN